MTTLMFPHFSETEVFSLEEVMATGYYINGLINKMLLHVFMT